MSQGRVRGAGSRGPIPTYAVRLARLHYLSHHFPNGHPVLDIERQLVQMAGAELREAALRLSRAGSGGIRAEIESRIRSASEGRLTVLVLDRDVRERLIEAVRKHDLSGILEGVD